MAVTHGCWLLAVGRWLLLTDRCVRLSLIDVRCSQLTQGDADKCATLIAKLLPAAAACTAWSVGCSTLTSSPTKSFYGAGNYFYTAKQLEHSMYGRGAAALSGGRASGVLNVSASDYWHHSRRMCSQVRAILLTPPILPLLLIAADLSSSSQVQQLPGVPTLS